MKQETTYQKILKHIKPKQYARVSNHIDELERLIREAHELLADYKDNQVKTIEDYEKVIFAIEKFRRDRWLPYPDSDHLGMYDKLLEDTSLNVKTAMKQMHKRLAKDGIDVPSMIKEATTMGEFNKYAEWFVSYNARKGNTGSVTLDDYAKAKSVQTMIENAGNSGISTIIIPMKNALEPYKLTLFDVIRFSDPVAETQLARARDFEGSVDLEVKRQANRRYIAKPNAKIADPMGGRAMVVGDAPHYIEDAYTQAYDTMRSKYLAKMKDIYSMSIASLGEYTYPKVSDFTQDIVDTMDNPTSN